MFLSTCVILSLQHRPRA